MQKPMVMEKRKLVIVVISSLLVAAGELSDKLDEKA